MSSSESDFQLSVAAPGMPNATFLRAIHSAAEEFSWEQHGIRIVVPEHRAIDAPTQIALIQLGSSVLAALVTGVFAVANARSSSKIVIVGKNGSRIELPGRANSTEIEHCVELLSGDPPKHIEIVHE
jgi:hypothetical protein